MSQSLYVALTSNIHIVVLCLCWYAISSLGSQVTKQILTVCPLPLFLGEFQFIYTALLAVLSCILAYHCSLFRNLFPVGTFPSNVVQTKHHAQRTIVTPPSKHILHTVLPLGLFQFVGKYFGHTATSLVPVSTIASIKTLSPIFILLIQRLLRINEINITTTVVSSLLSILVGVWIIVQQDNASVSTKRGSLTSDFIYGIICAIVSMLIFVIQNLYGKKVFTYKTSQGRLPKKTRSSSNSSINGLPIYAENLSNPETVIKYDKLTLMIYISLVGFCLSCGWFLTLELPILWKFFNASTSSNLPAEIPWKLLFLNGTFHFMQAMITYHLLGEVSTLTYSIANLMKRIAIISVSWVFAGHQITVLQIAGLILNGFGLFFYERCTSANKKGYKHNN